MWQKKMTVKPYMIKRQRRQTNACALMAQTKIRLVKPDTDGKNVSSFAPMLAYQFDDWFNAHGTFFHYYYRVFPSQ